MRLSNRRNIMIGLTLILALSCFIAVIFYAYSSFVDSREEKQIDARPPTKDYDLDGYATIDYPCKPEPNQVLKNSSQTYVQHSCSISEDKSAFNGRYVINLYKYSSINEMERLATKCSFQDKGKKTIHGHVYEICHMPVHDDNPSEVIVATLKDPAKNVRLEFFLSAQTYDEAYAKLVVFSRTLKIK